MSRGAAGDCSGSWTTIGAVEPSESQCKGAGAESCGVRCSLLYGVIISGVLCRQVSVSVVSLWWSCGTIVDRRAPSVKHLRLGFGLEVGNGAFGVPAFMC